MYACIRKTLLSNGKYFRPITLEYIQPDKHPTLTNYEIPKYDTDTYLALGNVYTHHWWYYHNIYYVKNNDYILEFTSSYDDAYDKLLQLAKTHKRQAKKDSRFIIYRISKDSNGRLRGNHAQFHQAARDFIEEMLHASSVEDEQYITLKYADCYVSELQYDGSKLIEDPILSGFSIAGSEPLYGESAGRNWCKWYKEEYMEDL